MSSKSKKTTYAKIVSITFIFNIFFPKYQILRVDCDYHIIIIIIIPFCYRITIYYLLVISNIISLPIIYILML